MAWCVEVIKISRKESAMTTTTIERIMLDPFTDDNGTIDWKAVDIHNWHRIQAYGKVSFNDDDVTFVRFGHNHMGESIAQFDVLKKDEEWLIRDTAIEEMSDGVSHAILSPDDFKDLDSVMRLLNDLFDIEWIMQAVHDARIDAVRKTECDCPAESMFHDCINIFVDQPCCPAEEAESGKMLCLSA